MLMLDSAVCWCVDGMFGFVLEIRVDLLLFTCNLYTESACSWAGTFSSRWCDSTVEVRLGFPVLASWPLAGFIGKGSAAKEPSLSLQRQLTPNYAACFLNHGRFPPRYGYLAVVRFVGQMSPSPTTRWVVPLPLMLGRLSNPPNDGHTTHFTPSFLTIQGQLLAQGRHGPLPYPPGTNLHNARAG